LSIAGEAGRAHVIEASTNLLSWAAIYTLSNAPALWEYVDAGASNHP